MISKLFPKKCSKLTEVLVKIIAKLFSSTFGKKSFQPFYRKLHSLSLRGLNYGMVGSGEEHVFKIVKSRLQKNSDLILFDVGANVGTYTEFLLKNFSSTCQIYSFEPSKITFAELKRNYSINGVHLQNLGLGKQNETIKLYKDVENSTLASAFKRTLNDNSLESFELMEVQTLDHFCGKNNIEKIDFLKIDVEGFDLNVILGANQLIKEQKISIIQFEFGGTQIEPRLFLKDFWDILSEQYEIARVLKDGLDPIEAYHERIENFSYANYLAIHKSLCK
ncbi:MAG: FkbM family methyltransferase [Psychromonas sp.]|jgi:FkbM family methyltransferase